MFLESERIPAMVPAMGRRRSPPLPGPLPGRGPHFQDPWPGRCGEADERRIYFLGQVA